MAPTFTTGHYREIVQIYGERAAGYAHSGEPTVEDRLHAATGIQEEAIELVEVVTWLYAMPNRDRREQLLGEMGGVLWYVNYAALRYGHTLADVMAAGKDVAVETEESVPTPHSYRAITMPLLKAARDVASLIRKHAYHGRPMPSTEPLLVALYRVWAQVAIIGGTYNVLVREALAYNLAQLEERHGGVSFNPAVYTATSRKESH
jgi:NTP pyrophosphatase (non-canonical NTP hydrolase)